MEWMVVFEPEEMDTKKRAAYHAELDELFQANERALQELGYTFEERAS